MIITIKSMFCHNMQCPLYCSNFPKLKQSKQSSNILCLWLWAITWKLITHYLTIYNLFVLFDTNHSNFFLNYLLKLVLLISASKWWRHVKKQSLLNYKTTHIIHFPSEPVETISLIEYFCLLQQISCHKQLEMVLKNWFSKVLFIDNHRHLK